MNKIAFASIFLLTIFIRCANQSAPKGGPQDKEPPHLMDSKPANNQTNFKGTEIELIFDEDLKLKDPKEEILITPSPGKDIKYVVKKNKVIIQPKNPWKDSTTYSITFREGIQDLTEGNATDDQHFAFSTGPYIDSLKISGSVNEVFKSEIPDKITIALYESDTFDITKHIPTYFTKANKEGKFSIQNLKPGLYSIYAFDDKNKNLKVESKTERYGFKAQKITLRENIDTLNIPLIRLDERKLKVTNIRHTDKISKVRFNKPIDSVTVTLEHPYLSKYTYGDTRAELNFYNNFSKEDSIKILIHASDSSLQTIDTTAYIKYTDNKTIVEQFKITGPTIAYDIETNSLQLKVSFNKPLSKILIDSIYIQTDSATFQQIQRKEIIVDTLNNKLTISTNLQLPKSQDKKSKANPVFILGKAAFISIENDSSKSQTKKIIIPKEDETGTLSIEIQTKKPHYEIQLISGKEVIRSIKDLRSKTFKYLTPQEYTINIIIDTNNNGRWDPGNFRNKIEPESVIIYRTLENKTGIPIRANWEVGPLLIKF